MSGSGASFSEDDIFSDGDGDADTSLRMDESDSDASMGSLLDAGS